MSRLRLIETKTDRDWLRLRPRLIETDWDWKQESCWLLHHIRDHCTLPTLQSLEQHSRKCADPQKMWSLIPPNPLLLDLVNNCGAEKHQHVALCMCAFRLFRFIQKNFRQGRRLRFGMLPVLTNVRSTMVLDVHHPIATFSTLGMPSKKNIT